MPTELIESNPYSLAIISVHTVQTDGAQHQHSKWQAVDTRFSAVFWRYDCMQSGVHYPRLSKP
jgi:hypothetical protein